MSKKRRLAKAKPTPPTQPAADHSPYVPQRDKIDWSLTIRHRADLTDKQKALIDLILDKRTNVVFINGPAGTTKTWIAVYCGLQLLQQHRISHVTFMRTIVESASKSLGFLPGDQNVKMDPYLRPLMEKLEELLPMGEVKRLMGEERCVGLPVNYARGASMNAQLLILEESQNWTVKELTTALTRLGRFSKAIVIGDEEQSDLPNGSGRGFINLFDWFNQPSYREHGIYCVSLTKDDILRSGIARVLVEALEAYRASLRGQSPH